MVDVVVVVELLLAGVLPNLEIHTSSIKGRNNHRIDPCWARERQARDISDDILAIQIFRTWRAGLGGYGMYGRLALGLKRYVEQ